MPPDSIEVCTAFGMDPLCEVAAVAIEKAAVPPNPASAPAITAPATTFRHAITLPTSRATMLMAATAPISHRHHTGPKSLRFSKTMDQAAASPIIPARARRPSHLLRRRQANTPPMPTSAAMAGANATV